MKITLLNVGKTDSESLNALIDKYTIRISRFGDFKLEYINTPKNFSKLKPAEMKKAEGELILKRLVNSDFVILLDEKGKSYTSVKFAQQIQKYMNAGYKNVCFVVGGAYGFSEAVYQKANAKLSLSEMTTTHQLIRLFFTEQIYRAFTILSGHPYHNE